MTIVERIQQINHLIADTATRYHRKAESIQLLGVTKGQPISAIRLAFEAGLKHFGENYLQEAKTKITALNDLPLCWHFIGPIQSNKTADIAQFFSWVHSVSREKIARLLSLHRSNKLPPLNICLQVNLDKEESKSGVEKVDDLKNLALLVNQLPNLTLRGLMAIPSPERNEEKQYASLMRLTNLLNALNKELNLYMDTLSMGMSEDFTAAIRAGSTIIRIGRAIFGDRTL